MNVSDFLRENASRLTPADLIDAMKEQGFDTARIYDLLAPALAQVVRESPVSVEGFCAYYECKFKRPVPPVVRHVWAPEFVEAYLGHSGVLLEGHRGQAKSTFLITWIEYLTGKRPVGSSQLIRINQQQAQEADELISSTIEFSPAWKLCFPNVVPDKEKGWSISGRFVKDTSVSDYGAWLSMCSADHLSEPSFLCSGITSRDFIGKHPSNGQYFDDLHDEGNTRSQREMQEIVDIVEKNIVPTWTRPDSRPVLGVACTLWSPNDAYHALLKTGMFKHVKTPICVPADNPYIQIGDKMVHPAWIDRYAPFELDGEKMIPLWDKYPGQTIAMLKRRNPVYFPLMYLCDMNAMQGRVLRAEWLHVFEREKVHPSWPVYFGIDFASTEDKLKDKERDYFALAVLAAIPWGGAVLIDGFREHLGFFEAVERVRAFASKYPTLVTVGVEKWGSGEKFKEALLYNSSLPVIPFPFDGAPVRSKGQRYQGELAPMFIDGRLWITEDGEFIKRFKEEWVSWDGGKTATGHDDCLDAVYIAAGVAQGYLAPKVKNPSLEFSHSRGLASPWAGLGRT